jgi:hypothetical protein
LRWMVVGIWKPAALAVQRGSDRESKRVEKSSFKFQSRARSSMYIS